jgi:hypothetical protein
MFSNPSPTTAVAKNLGASAMALGRFAFGFRVSPQFLSQLWLVVSASSSLRVAIQFLWLKMNH